MARGSSNSVRAASRFLATHPGLALSTGGEPGEGGPRHDQRRAVRSRPEAGRDPGATRHDRVLRGNQLPLGRGHIRRRQSANTNIWKRRARIYASSEYRSRCHGRVHRVTPANHRFSGSGPDHAVVVTVGSLQAGTKENVIPDESNH
jgi:hypothetical protein